MMANATCRLCAKPAPNSCGRCAKANYCSKECAREDWPTHKRTCMNADMARNIINKAIVDKANTIAQKFAGNIMIAHAWAQSDGRVPTITITFTETAKEFVDVQAGTMFYIGREFTGANNTVINIKLILRDYTAMITLPIRGDASKIRKKFEEPPTHDWVMVV